MADLGPAAAYLTLEALTEVNRPDEEGYWKQFSSSRWVAWKTGTSFGLRDAWAVGVTPAYTVGIWAGNADGEGNPDLTGLSTAAPVLFEVLQALDTGGAITPPRLWLKELRVCRDSGYLAGELCPAVAVAMPRESHFQQACPFHQLVHLDARRRFRVDSSCESPARMVHEPWFVLPPVQEYYYRRSHPEYRTAAAFPQRLRRIFPRPRREGRSSASSIPISRPRSMSRSTWTAVPARWCSRPSIAAPRPRSTGTWTTATWAPPASSTSWS